MFVDEASGTYTGREFESPRLHQKHSILTWRGGIERTKQNAFDGGVIGNRLVRKASGDKPFDTVSIT